MRAQDVERFVDLPYHLRHADCVDLVLQVQRELFGRSVSLPGKRPRPVTPADQAAVLADYAAQHVRPTSAPVDGDLVLMADIGQAKVHHAGVFFFLAHEPWVLHSSQAMGCSVLQRVHDLPRFGVRIEGFYQWI